MQKLARVTLAVFLVIATTLAIDAEETGRGASVDEIMEDLRRVADGYPPRVENAEERAQVLEQWRRAEQALLEGASADADPSYALLLTLGDLYRMGHNLDVDGAQDAAASYLEDAIDLDPTRYDAHWLLGRHFTHSGSFSQGEEELLRAFVLAPENVARVVDFDLAFAEFYLSNHALAAFHADRYLTITPESKSMQFISEMAGKKLAEGSANRSIDIESGVLPEDAGVKVAPN